MMQMNWQPGSARRKVATLTMSAAFAVTFNSPRTTSCANTDAGSAVWMVAPSLASMSSILIHDKEARASFGMRAVGIGAVGDLVAHAGFEREGAPVFQIGRQFAIDAEKDMPLLAPMIGDVTGRIVDHAHADIAEVSRPPRRYAGIPAIR